MLLQLSHFPPFNPLHPAHPLPPTFAPYSSCPWVIHVSSLASTFPIIFLTSPCLFSTYYLCYLFSVHLPTLSPSHSPTNNSPCDLHFCSSVPVLVVCLVFVFVLGSVINNCEFVVILLFIFSIIFSYISPFNILYKGLVMMNSFNLTLAGKHFICPSILNESFAE